MFDIIPNNRKKNRDIFNFDNFFSEFFPENFFPHTEGRMMKIDIKELDTAYTFDVELPGVSKEDIEINVVDDVLSITINKIEEVNEENTKFVRKERKFGTYSRSFSIPDVDTDNIKANYDNGVLKLTLPKTTQQEAPKRNINIE